MTRKVIAGLLCLVSLAGCMPQTEAADAASVVYAEVADRIGDGEQAGWITDAIFYASDLYQVDPLLVAAMMEQESSFSMEATSSAGAIGLMQLMPRTAAGIGIDPYDPLQNVLGGVFYLRTLLDSFASWGEYAVTDAVAGYNTGGQAVIDHGGVPMYGETVAYVRAVDAAYRRLLSYCEE